jgi:ankyrin repeat protein
MKKLFFLIAFFLFTFTGVKSFANTANLFFEAIRNGNLIAMREVLDDGFEVNKIYLSDGHLRETPLVYAIKKKNIDAVKFLVKYGADVNFIDKNDIYSLSPLMLSIGMYTNEQTETSYNNIEKILNFLIENKADIELGNAALTPLIVALSGSNDKKVFIVTKRLLELGANPNKGVGHSKVSPILWITTSPTTLNSKKSLVKLLLHYGAELNIQNTEGSTILHILASEIYLKYDILEIVKILLEKGADPKIRNYENKTAFEIALEQKNFELFKLLFRYF